ncbi:hypothetical protein ACHAQH_007206 [Verticillium albo-atrum]
MISYLRHIRTLSNLVSALTLMNFRNTSLLDEIYPSSPRQLYLEFDNGDLVVLRPTRRLPRGTWKRAVQYLMKTGPYLGQSLALGIEMGPDVYPGQYNSSDGTPSSTFESFYSEIVNECREA